VVFNGTATNGGSTPVLQWLVNGIPSGVNSSSFSTSSLQNGDVVSCVLTSSLNCVTSPTATSNSLAMIINPGISNSVNIVSALGNTICSGTSTTFNATAVNGGSNPVYQWQINGINSGTNSSSFTTSALQNGDVVTCLMTSSVACPLPAIAQSNSISMIVNNLVTPTISIVSNQGMPVCEGELVSFTSTASNQGLNPQYNWTVNGVVSGTNSPNFSPSTLSDADVISCELISSASCVTSNVATSNSIIFDVVVIDSTVTQSVNMLTSNQNNASYQWIDCSTSQPLAGETQQSLSVTQTGTYAVQITIGSCTETSACTNVQYNGIGDFDWSVSLMPNPAMNVLYVNIEQGGAFELSCMDMSGRLIQTWNLVGETNEIQLEHLATGSYYFRISSEQRQVTRKIVVVRD
jgi:hypothetical protein